MIDWPRIEQFVGYGRLAAPIVFVGLEEGLANEAAVHDDLLRRSQFESIVDVKEAHKGIADGESLFTDSPRRQPTWRVMADVMLHFEGRRFSSDEVRASERKAYRAKRLGRKDGNSLLTELLPYPHRNTGSWLYGEKFSGREAYVDAILPQRIKLLDDVLLEHPRKAVICYGRSEWPNFKRLFQDVPAWRTQGRFECADWHGAKVTLTDHFVTKYFNTDSELDELSAVVLRA
jgi:hypothetical protein